MFEEIMELLKRDIAITFLNGKLNPDNGLTDVTEPDDEMASYEYTLEDEEIIVNTPIGAITEKGGTTILYEETGIKVTINLTIQIPFEEEPDEEEGEAEEEASEEEEEE